MCEHCMRRPVKYRKHMLCSACYQRERAQGNIDVNAWTHRSGSDKCACGQYAKVKGMCSACYSRSERKKRGVEVGSRPGGSYASIHSRVKRTHGAAREHTCACGREAAAWSYVGGDPDEKRGLVNGSRMPMRWSLKDEYYIAECNPCHRRRDSEQRIADRLLLFQMLDSF